MSNKRNIAIVYYDGLSQRKIPRLGGWRLKQYVEQHELGSFSGIGKLTPIADDIDKRIRIAAFFPNTTLNEVVNNEFQWGVYVTGRTVKTNGATLTGDRGIVSFDADAFRSDFNISKAFVYKEEMSNEEWDVYFVFPPYDFILTRTSDAYIFDSYPLDYWTKFSKRECVLKEYPINHTAFTNAVLVFSELNFGPPKSIPSPFIQHLIRKE